MKKNIRSYKCNIEDCGNFAYANGLCNGHYIRQRKGNFSAESIKIRRDKCSLCDKPHYGSGYCQNHYNKNSTKKT